MSLSISTEPAWNPQMVLDIALESYTLEELLDKYSLEQYQLDDLYENINFRKELLRVKSSLTADGSMFKSRARALAELHLETINELLTQIDTPAATKVSIWQALVKYASLEPKKEIEDAGPLMGGINIQINM